MSDKTTAATYPATFTIGGDLPVNRLGYGAMRITGEGIWGPPADHDESIRVLKRAVELGVNFIDTADSYGPNVSEELIAEALYPYAKGLVIATKGGLLRTGPNEWPIDASPKHLEEALNGSLKRLKVEQIDLYQLHRIDPKVPFEDTLKFLQKAQQDGRIKHIGLSEVSVADIKKAQEFVPIVSVQNMYSVENRKWEAELTYTREQNIAFIPWFPLGGGNADALKALDQIAARHGVKPQQIALSWLLHHSPNILLIPGTSKVKHLEENMKTADIHLSAEDMKALDAVQPA
ncbi:aldo/keto reductase [Hymenobacter negativus]|uniref:Aldo/keto reductase n=1 Tax=Hymenobacter negativus TaxID=2795026 RepID=A0ABS0Q6U1_9BACT|nr:MULTISPECIES: aldo/keto reductase [Bacteria]MBH8557966.1 aldo/keto reductase [Hymenobacter negativus]MBH8567491.1 aldo/keto reductase [Hymenobacter negativus]MBR7207223.1 aldo/keto reductase [Microvirga sp. STS02]